MLQDVEARRAEVRKYQTNPAYKKEVDDERRARKKAEVSHQYAFWLDSVVSMICITVRSAHYALDDQSWVLCMVGLCLLYAVHKLPQ